MRLITFGSAFTFILLAISVPTMAASIAGEWRGNGTATLKSGQTESIRCRATFTKENRRYLINGKCSTGAGNFVFNGGVSERGSNRFAGRLRDEHYMQTGWVVITVNGNTMKVIANGDQGIANATLSRQ